MPRKKTPHPEELRYRLYTRVNEKKYKEFQALLAKNPQMGMSGLLREILHNRPVRVYTRDLTLDNLMEELAKLRSELKAIGININQMTRFFNTYPEIQRKVLYAKIGFKEYQAIEPKVEELLAIITQLAKKWLSD